MGELDLKSSCILHSVFIEYLLVSSALVDTEDTMMEIQKKPIVRSQEAFSS